MKLFSKVKKEKKVKKAEPMIGQPAPQPTPVKEKKKGISKSGIVLIVGLCIIAIPVIVFVAIILSASLKTGTPISGDRFKNDLVNEIKKSHVSTIEDDIERLSNVQEVEVELLDTGRLTIFVDVTDSLSEEETTKLAEEVYNKVIETLPVQTYFTATDNAKMYDLSINVYTTMEDSPSRTYIIVTKNSKVELPTYQNVAKPLDEELAKELRGETVPEEEPSEEPQE